MMTRRKTQTHLICATNKAHGRVFFQHFNKIFKARISCKNNIIINNNREASLNPLHLQGKKRNQKRRHKFSTSSTHAEEQKNKTSTSIRDKSKEEGTGIRYTSVLRAWESPESGGSIKNCAFSSSSISGTCYKGFLPGS